MADYGLKARCADTTASTMHMPKPEASDSFRGTFRPKLSNTWISRTAGNGSIASKIGAVIWPDNEVLICEQSLRNFVATVEEILKVKGPRKSRCYFEQHCCRAWQ